MLVGAPSIPRRPSTRDCKTFRSSKISSLIACIFPAAGQQLAPLHEGALYHQSQCSIIFVSSDTIIAVICLFH